MMRMFKRLITASFFCGFTFLASAYTTSSNVAIAMQKKTQKALLVFNDFNYKQFENQDDNSNSSTQSNDKKFVITSQ